MMTETWRNETSICTLSTVPIKAHNAMLIRRTEFLSRWRMVQRWIFRVQQVNTHQMESPMMCSSNRAGIRCRSLAKALGAGGRTLRIATEDIAVAPGSCAAIIGENGIGKTVLLRMMAGSILPDSGTVMVDRPLVAFTDIERQLHQRLSATENARYVLTLFGGGSVSRHMISEQFARAGLDRHERVTAGKLSKGQKSRLALSIVALGSWLAILVDEPTGGLDRDGLEFACAVISRKKSQGAAVVVTTHDREFVRTCSDGLIFRNDRNVFELSAAAHAGFEDMYVITLRNGVRLKVGSAELGKASLDHADQIESIVRRGLAPVGTDSKPASGSLPS